MNTLAILMSAFILSIVGLGFFIWSQRSRLASTTTDGSEVIFAKGELGHPESITQSISTAHGPAASDNLELQARVLEEFGSRVLFKPEAVPIGPRLSALREATGGKAAVFEGSGGIALVDSYRRGIVGTMPGGEMPDAIMALWNALEAGDEDRVYRISQPVSALVAMQSGLDGFLAVEKHLLHRRGIFPNTVVRGPVGFRLDEETRQEVDRLFDQLMAVLAE